MKANMAYTSPTRNFAPALLVGVWLAIPGVNVAKAAETADTYRTLAESYRQKDTAGYLLKLRSFFAQIEHAQADKVLALAQELARSCAQTSCDGLQPLALALADRISNLPHVSEAEASEALAPIFVSGKFPGKLARNFTLPVWNSRSVIVRNLRADAVQAMFERRGALIGAGEGKVPTNALLAMGAMQADFCELSYLPQAAGTTQIGDRERQRQSACEKLAIDGMNSASRGLPAQSTAPVIDAVTASMCASVTVQTVDTNIWQQTSEIAQECFSTTQPGDKYSVADGSGSGGVGYKAAHAMGDTDADGRQWWDVSINTDEYNNFLVYGTRDEVRRIYDNPAAFLVDQQGFATSPKMHISPNLGPAIAAAKEEAAAAKQPPVDPVDDDTADTTSDDAEVPGTGTGASPPEPKSDQSNGAQLPGGGERTPSGEACDALSNQLELIGSIIKGGTPRTVDLSAGRPSNPTIVNPDPESPWGKSGAVQECSGWVDPQQGAMCNLPVMCNEGFQVNDNCACEPDRQQTVLLELIGTQRQSECASMLCPLQGDCLCTAGDEEPVGTGVPSLPPDKGPGGDPVERKDP